MSFGSYFSGIYLTQLDPNSGKPINSAVQQIAASSQVRGQSMIEASYLYHQGSYYYLFVNYGMCCMGVNSTYNVRVGRATSVNGPYLDQNGVNMTQGGGTMFLSTQGKYIGPGQVGIMPQGSNYWLSYHYYDGTNNGAATYALEQMYWTDQGWPSLTVPTPTALTWNNTGGTGDGATWDSAGNQNWNYGTGPAMFTNGDNVTFNNTNNNHFSVAVNAAVSPGSIVFSNTMGNYIISGAGTIGGTGSLSKSGAGTVTLSTSNAYSGGTTVTGGALLIGVNGALPVGAVSVTGGTLQLGTSTGLATVTSLSVTGAGKFDINNNHVIINYGSGSDPISSIVALLATGYAAGSWNGAGGIISTAAVANSASYGLGYADSADAGNPAHLASGTIEIKYTLLGDTDLNGVVNGIDFGILAANFNKSVSRWDQGDFNYDNIVNGIDFGSLAANFNKGASGASFGASALSDPALVTFAQANGLMADVPEPGAIAVFAALEAGLLLRRRRNA
jgi:autotransporter-associated beta strand protein